MSRIAYRVPMQAFDHVVDQIVKAGGEDGVVRPEDVSRLVQSLRNEGRGTEARVVSNLHTMIDAMERAGGQGLTRENFENRRTHVAERMLQNRDVQRNGFTPDEVAKMSPTGQALVELGRVLEMGEPRSRVSHASVQRAVRHMARMLQEATGADPFLSKGDMEKLQNNLYAQGRGTEGLAARYFLDLAPPSGRTASWVDLDAAVKTIFDKIRSADTNSNGFSRDELASLSPGEKAIVLVGRMLDAGIIKQLGC